MAGELKTGVMPGPALARVSRYRVPGHPAPIELDLRGNEGPAPRAALLDALAEVTPDAVRRYPSAAALEARLAEGWGLTPEQVVVTAGADDGLDRICRAMLGPGRRLVYPTPGFVMTPRAARLAGAEVVEVPWVGALPVEAIVEAARPGDVVVITSPNNPTGAVVAPATLGRLAEGLPEAALLVLDLAYGEFAEVDLRPLALELPRTLVVGTFSKAWGLAGLRVGHVAGPAELVGWLRDVGLPYAVSGPSLALAERALALGDAPVRAHVEAVRGARACLSETLTGLGVEVTAGEGNFVFARSPRAPWITAALAGLGVGIRAFPGSAGLEDAFRIACPTEPAALDRVRAALEAALAPQAVLFDLDGVLADVSRSYRAAIIGAAARFGVVVTAADIAAVKQAGDANNDWVVTRRLLSHAGVEAPLSEITEAFEALYQGSESTPGLWATERLTVLRPALSALASAVPLAVVTGRPRRDAERFLEGMEIAHRFEAVVCMEDAPAKPDPASVRQAMARLGVTRAWMLGDTPDDVRAARRAGVVPLGVVAPGAGSAPREIEALSSAGAAEVYADPAEALATLSERLGVTR